MTNPSGVVYQSETSPWEPHPFAEGLERRVLLSQADHGAGVSIFLLRVKPGWRNIEVEEHVHEAADDIAYLLSGSATVVVEGYGEQPLRAGAFIRIPKGVRHRVHSISEDFVAINQFCPATY
jgi:quercetin dioxygenase-like cupin family protein